MLDAYLQALQETPVATAIREGGRLFPWIECVHVLALALVVGSIAVVDLRLIGLASRDRGVAETTAAVLPVTWSAFLCAAVSGALMFSSNAAVYAHNGCFQIKMALIAAAGINMSVYHLCLSRGMEAWHSRAMPPMRVRIAGGLSLCLWIAVVACGRWIGFTMDAPL